MPSPQELLGLLIVIAVIWLVLKVARAAIKLILFVISLIVIGGALWWIFMR